MSVCFGLDYFNELHIATVRGRLRPGKLSTFLHWRVSVSIGGEYLNELHIVTVRGRLRLCNLSTFLRLRVSVCCDDGILQ